MEIASDFGDPLELFREAFIINHFWNLGDSKSRGNQYAIGEKGHGTKIYLRSDKVLVQTNDGIDSYETECEGAFFSLNAGEVHSPKAELLCSKILSWCVYVAAVIVIPQKPLRSSCFFYTS